MQYLTREELIEDLTGIRNSINYVTGSAAMVLHGLAEEARDIDVHIDQKKFDLLAKLYPDQVGITPVGDARCLKEGTWELIEGDFIPEPRCDIIDGIPVLTLDSLLRYKRKLNRDKDRESILILEKAIAEGRE